MRWTLVLLMALLSSCASTTPVCNHVNMDWIRTQAPLPEGTELIQKNDMGNICEAVVTIEGNIVPLYAGSDFIIVGKLFKDNKFITGETLESLKDVANAEAEKALKKKKNKTEAIKAFFKQNLSTLEELTVFSFTPDRANRFLYLVTDPRCSHCKHLIKELKKLAVENNFEIKMVLFPLMGPESYNMVGQAICDEISFEEYGKLEFKQSTKPCSDAEKLIEKTMAFFSEADMTVVPVVIAGDGSWVVKGANVPKIKKYLGIGGDDCDDDDPGAGCGEVQ